MTIPHDTDIYELMTTPGAEVTVVAKGKTKEKEIKMEPWPVNIDPEFDCDYPLEINHKK